MCRCGALPPWGHANLPVGAANTHLPVGANRGVNLCALLIRSGVWQHGHEVLIMVSVNIFPLHLRGVRH